MNADVKSGASIQVSSSDKKNKGEGKSNNTGTNTFASDTYSVFGDIPTYQPLVTSDSANL